MTRRRLLTSTASLAAAAFASSLMPPNLRKALADPPQRSGLQDIKHVVILMQENRSFDHYFGTLRGVRGFGDRHPVPLASGKPIWYQSDGKIDILPFRLNTKVTSALRVPGTPHSFEDAQAAWNQGNLDIGRNTRHRFPWAITSGRTCNFNLRSRKLLRFVTLTTVRSRQAPIRTELCFGPGRTLTRLYGNEGKTVPILTRSRTT